MMGGLSGSRKTSPSTLESTLKDGRLWTMTHRAAYCGPKRHNRSPQVTSGLGRPPPTANEPLGSLSGQGGLTSGPGKIFRHGMPGQIDREDTSRVGLVADAQNALVCLDAAPGN